MLSELSKGAGWVDCVTFGRSQASSVALFRVVVLNYANQLLSTRK